MLKPNSSYSKLAKFLYLLDKAGVEYKKNMKIDWQDNMIILEINNINILGDIIEILRVYFAEVVDYIMKIEYVSGIMPVKMVILFKELIITTWDKSKEKNEGETTMHKAKPDTSIEVACNKEVAVIETRTPRVMRVEIVPLKPKRKEEKQKDK